MKMFTLCLSKSNVYKLRVCAGVTRTLCAGKKKKGLVHTVCACVKKSQISVISSHGPGSPPPGHGQNIFGS